MTRWQRKTPSICGQSRDAERSNSINTDDPISFVANNTQENSIYTSATTVETIIEKYGLQTKLERLSASPQMGTFQLFEHLGNGDFSECPLSLRFLALLLCRTNSPKSSLAGVRPLSMHR